MNLSILHSFMGDNEVEFDTTTEEGRKRIGEVLNKLLKAGTAIFLERADKTYRVTGWDPATDQLVIQAPGRWPTGEARHAIPEKPAPQLPAAAESLQEAQDDVPDRDEEAIACKCERCSCTHFVKDTSRTGICTPCQQNRHPGKLKPRPAKKKTVRAGTSRGRMTAVAPTAGG